MRIDAPNAAKNITRSAVVHVVVTRGSPPRHIDPLLAGAIVGGKIGV
jgi:hypothetical protein